MLRRLLAGVVLSAPFAATADVGVNLYGLSYHFDRERARALGVDNETNPGIGLRYRVPHSERLQWIFDIGAYRDSGGNTARLAGAGALWKMSEGWRMGGALAALHSDTYNRGKAFLAPLPIAAYQYRAVTLNFTFFPKVSEVNEIPTLAFWVTWWPSARD